MSSIASRFLAAACLALACSDEDASDGLGRAGPERGELLSLTPLGSLDSSQLADYLSGFDIDTASVRFGVEAYRVEYLTVDPDGALVRASSLVAFPASAASVLEQAVWMHGTTVYKGEVASVSEESSDRATTYFFAAAGYATTAPDYVGLGVGDGPHPYDHLPTEVTAGIDALRATEEAARQLGRRLGTRVAISGHSQGGPATVALAHQMQEMQQMQPGGADGLELATAAALSGPYDMSGTLAIAAQGGIDFVTAYLAYLTVAWNRRLGLYSSPSEAFLPPYDQTLERLFDNEHTVEEVFAGLPKTLEEMFTPTFLERLRAPSGALRVALDQADQVCAWQPDVEVTLYASSADAEVPIENAQHCVASFRESGAEVALVDVGDATHSESMTDALPLVLAQFERARIAH